jgi:spore germination protein GerM
MSPAQRGILGSTTGPLLLVTAALLLSFGCGGGEPAEQAEAEPTEPTLEPETEGESADDPTATPIMRRRVEVYFPSAADEGLIGEFREIFNTANPGDRAKQIIADLISGPETESALRALPPTTRLRQVYVMDNGIAYLDFSSDLREGMGGGSMEEILAVYAIVNSVVININEVHRVGILVNGRTVATLNGHLDLRRPLRPDYSLILESVIVRAPVQRSRPQTPAA